MDQARASPPRPKRLAAILQVGYYFRHHPLFRHAKERVAAGDLGELRYLSGIFAGFKRARADIGVTASDAVHFLDYFNWLVGAAPARVQAMRRDHFGRGLDDLALILLEYPDGVAAKIEAGLIQPGRHADLITPGALTSKEVALCGSAGAIEIDFPAERLVWHRVRHERSTASGGRSSRTPASGTCRPPARSTCSRASSGSSSVTSPRAAGPRPTPSAAASTSPACSRRSSRPRRAARRSR